MRKFDRYYVINKETKQVAFFSGFRSDCEKFVNELIGKADFDIIRKVVTF